MSEHPAVTLLRETRDWLVCYGFTEGPGVANGLLGRMNVLLTNAEAPYFVTEPAGASVAGDGAVSGGFVDSRPPKGRSRWTPYPAPARGEWVPTPVVPRMYCPGCGKTVTYLHFRPTDD